MSQFDRASIVRWHENCARGHEHAAANLTAFDRSDDLEKAAFHRRCADEIVNRADLEDPQSFCGHPFREQWLKSKLARIGEPELNPRSVQQD